ncbi:hypothetical protein AWV79_35825 [Cupriavidus sp. UYMMa02A]|nr:hypothetical protein AWV79_35825 [Cupriavidus sp. UYMMa02A]
MARRKAANAPKGVGALTLPALKVSVVIEKDSLVLLFTEPPASLFLTDRKTGASVENVEWVSDTIIRMPLSDMREIELKTPNGAHAIRVEGGQLFHATESTT